MKKITFLFITLLFFSASFSQIVLTEDFEGGLSLPPGWTNNDIAAGGDVWTFATGGEAVGYSSPNTIYYVNGLMVGNYALFNSDGYGDNSIPENAALESPIFSCAGLVQVTLNFNHFFTEGFGGAAFVEVFNGASWVQVASYTVLDFGLVSLDVSTELAGVSNAQVRFRWTGDYSWGWAFDNVSVFECTVAAPNAVVSATTPTDAATDVAITYGSTTNTVGPFEWMPSATGDPTDSFNFSIGITPTGDDIGTISGFSSGGNVNYSWTPNTLYYWRVDAVNCAGSTQGPVWSFRTAACAASGPPNPVITPGPSNGATNVNLDNTDSNFPNRVYFSWVDAIGEPGDSFTLNLGTTNPPTDSSFDDFTNGDFIFNLLENTTYFWSIEAVNCAGTSTPTVWSFTTETVLSVNENELDLFNVYPNPVKDIVRIETSLTIDSVKILNQLGQNVLTINNNRTINNEIDLSSLSNGLYFMKISSGNRSESIKIIKE
jgi:hypothetical protein